MKEQLNRLTGKDLVKAGYALAAEILMDSQDISMAGMVSHLAAELNATIDENALMRALLHTSLAGEREHDCEMMRRGGAEALEQFARTLLKETDSCGEMTGFSMARSACQYAARLRARETSDA